MHFFGISPDFFVRLPESRSFFLPDFSAHSSIFQGKILFLYILTDSGPELREKIRRLRIVFFPVREYNADVF